MQTNKSKQSKQQTKTVKKTKKRLEKAVARAADASYAYPESAEINHPGDLGFVKGVKAILSGSYKTDFDRAMAHYIRNLVDPESEVGAKVPDSYTIPTATYQSVYTYSTQGNSNALTGAADLGRFCFYIKPIMSAVTPFNSIQNLNCFSFTADNMTWTGGFTNTVYDYQPDPQAGIMIPAAPAPGGLAVRARCVGCSAWVDYQGSTLLDGGSIAAAVLPADIWALNLANNVGMAAGNLVYWENLAEVRGAYQGKIKKGCYTWWKPNSSMDTNFYPVDQVMGPNAWRFQSPEVFVISGIIPPSSGTTGQPSNVRLRLVLNYEYENYSRVVTQMPSPFMPGVLEVTEMVLAGRPQAMANDEHESFIGRILKTAIAAGAGFLLGGPAGAAAGVLGSIGAAKISL